MMRLSITSLVLWLNLSLAGGLLAASAQKPDVMRLLQGYEWQLSEVRFNALPQDTYLTLIEIAQDQSTISLIRGRAMAALTLYENDSAWQFFRQVMETSAYPTQQRRAVEAICSTFLASKPMQLKQAMMPLLAANDVHLRTRVANCLGEINAAQPDSELEAALFAYRDTIKETWEKRAAGFEPESSVHR